MENLTENNSTNSNIKAVLFRITGDLMTPQLPSETIVSTTQIRRDQWKNASGVVAVMCDRGVIIRRIKENDFAKTDIIRLYADNSDYEPIEIHLNELDDIFDVNEIVSKEIV